MSATNENQDRQEQVSPDVTETPAPTKTTQQDKREKRSNWLYGCIAAIFLIAVIASVVWRSDFIPKTAKAVTIDDKSYTAAEVSFYYNNVYLNFVNNFSYVLSYLDVDTSLPLNEQTISETAAAMLGVETGESWHDYFADQAFIQMATIQSALEKAEAEGFVYPESIQVQLDDAKVALEGAASASAVSVDQYLKNSFGTNMSEKLYYEELLRMLQYEAYANAYNTNLTYSDSEINDAYAADPNTYDEVSYEYVMISGAAEGTTDADGNTVAATEEETAAAMAAAKQAADEMLAAFRAGRDLEVLANANEKASYMKRDGATYSGDILTEWLFDSSRKVGDSTVLESGTYYYVAVFHGRGRNEDPTIDVRHILITPETGTLAATDEGYEAEQAQLKEAAMARADELLAQWKNGEATEDSFAALAAQESADGSKYVGGLYTSVYPGQMVPAFNDWCFDSSRKSGDTDVVETEYGAHVMYFVSHNLPYWQTQVVSTLKSEDYNAWIESLSTNSNIERHDFGMKFVG